MSDSDCDSDRDSSIDYIAGRVKHTQGLAKFSLPEDNMKIIQSIYNKSNKLESQNLIIDTSKRPFSNMMVAL